jgi:hypothetical protein
VDGETQEINHEATIPEIAIPRLCM